MMTRLLSFLALYLALASPSVAGLGDVSCDDSARLSRTLSQVLGAERQGMGLRDPETTIEVWVVARNGDWLLVQTYTNGTSCIVAMGEYWEGPGQGPA